MKKNFLVHLWWNPMNIQPYSSVAVSSLQLPRVCDFAPCSWQCMKNQRLAQTINPLMAFFWPKLLISFWSQGFHYFLGILTRPLKGCLLHFNQNWGGGYQCFPIYDQTLRFTNIVLRIKKHILLVIFQIGRFFFPRDTTWDQAIPTSALPSAGSYLFAFIDIVPSWFS